MYEKRLIKVSSLYRRVRRACRLSNVSTKEANNVLTSLTE